MGEEQFTPEEKTPPASLHGWPPERTAIARTAAQRKGVAMTDNERYQQVDLPFYEGAVAPALPPTILDFHAHVWRPEHFLERPWDTERPGGKYMVTDTDYPVEALLSDGRRLFPDRGYEAVCFGQPTPAADWDACNAYLASARRAGLHPLMLVGRDRLAASALEARVRDGGFLGYKVILNWIGDDYGSIRVSDLIGPAEMALADRLGLVVLLHVPRSGRLADPEVQREVREYAQGYPNARIVLAHCGRCYLPDEMEQAIGAIRDLPNVYLDTAMVMDPTVLQIAFEAIGSHRVLFATDLPVAAMRGRRVYAMDHWVDLVLPGYPESAYRVAAPGIRATFMAWEIVLAIARAARRAGLTEEEMRGIFYGNGRAVLRL
jgi:hypothetical protein